MIWSIFPILECKYHSTCPGTPDISLAQTSIRQQWRIPWWTQKELLALITIQNGWISQFHQTWVTKLHIKPVYSTFNLQPCFYGIRCEDFKLYESYPGYPRFLRLKKSTKRTPVCLLAHKLRK